MKTRHTLMIALLATATSYSAAKIGKVTEVDTLTYVTINSKTIIYAGATDGATPIDSVDAGVQFKRTSIPNKNFFQIEWNRNERPHAFVRQKDVTPLLPGAVDTAERATFPCPMTTYTKTVRGHKISYKVADIYDERKVYKKDKDVKRENCFIVVSKQEYRLYVYEKMDKDTVLVAHYPVCYGMNTYQKTRSGDMTTPHCTMANRFRIMQIQDYSGRAHDFGDGRDSILSYGHWFMRLDLSKAIGLNANVRANRTIGIHGSTNNRESVPGNNSEGCIRLRDEDICHLHDNYAMVGTPVVVKPYEAGKYDFEVKAEKALGPSYYAPTKGYKPFPEQK